MNEILSRLYQIEKALPAVVTRGDVCFRTHDDAEDFKAGLRLLAQAIDKLSCVEFTEVK